MDDLIEKMSDCGATDTAAVDHTRKAFGTAQDVIEKVLNGHPYPSLVMGQVSIIRKKLKRPVHFIEVDDGSGARLRVEVYTL